MKITLRDGKTVDVPERATPEDVLQEVEPGLDGKVVCARLDGDFVHLTQPLTEEGELEFIRGDSEEGLGVVRHSAAHIMADAVLQLHPGAQLGFGPSLKDTFYYDIRLPEGEHLQDDDLRAIEGRMKKIINEDTPFVRKELSHEDAMELMEELDQEFKCDALRTNLADEETVTIYEHGDGRFKDLCRGPHVPSTGWVRAVQLLNLAGAYWKGREGNPQLQRLYGTAWRSKKDLRKFLKRREEAAKRDHRKIGRDLSLFSFSQSAPGFPFWHPHGKVVYNELETFLRGLYAEYGYKEVNGPIILDQELWQRSGHYENYRENMYFTEIDEGDYAVKPMNCPGHCLMFNAEPRSYRDLPLRFAEFGLVHRHELSGVLHGLFRVRSFTQDDAHIFCTEEQIEDEIVSAIEMLKRTYQVMGFHNVRVELSTRPEKSIGSDAIWEKATDALKKALERADLSYKINPGDGAFYGPKIDFHIRDCMDRSWQCGTVQLDFSMPAPERLDCSYHGEDNESHVPVLIHRAILGSFERFIGILTEHYAGAFPVWLAPEQARVLSITDDQADYVNEIVEKLKAEGLRVTADVRGDKIGKKIRDGAVAKVPYLLICGDRELEAGTVAVRPFGSNRNEGTYPVDEFIDRLRSERDNRVTPSEGALEFAAEETAQQFEI